MTIVSGQTNELPYLPHLHVQRDFNFTPIVSSRETVATDPDLPGVALRIPPGTPIVGWDGLAAKKVSIRTVPLDRLPVRPLPAWVRARTVYMFYFGKRGGGIPSRPVPFEAPNDLGLAPGDQAELWYFDESPNPGEAPNDWRMAGTGTVSPDGRTIVTDPGVGIPKFCCGAAAWSTGSAPATGPKPGNPAHDGEPVDLGTGLFVVTKTDLALPDVVPLALTRTYRPGDTVTRPFGIGTTHPWAIFLWSNQPYQQVDLILPDGGRVHYVRISPGTGASDAVLEHTATPTRFYKSRVTWNATTGGGT